MSLTPQDIQKQKFSTKFRGFDVDEVDAFLEEVAESFLVLIQENKKLKEQLDVQEQRETAQKTEEQTFKAAMIAAQKVAEEMQERARQEASLLVARARDEAGVLQAEANMKVDKARAELEELSTMAERVRGELRATLNHYLDFLEGGPQPAAELTPPPQVRAVAAPAVEPAFEPIAEPAEEAIAAATLEPAAETEEITSEKGLDEQTLAEPFQEDGAAKPEEGPDLPGAADDTEDFTDLFERMEIPDTVAGEEEEGPIGELTTDMLFSEEPAGDEESGPALTIAEEDEEPRGPKQR